jgi:predicted CXXCH cytochrome family protein
MKKLTVLIGTALFLALPMVASADLVGDCYDCHTMHNSEQNAAVIATAQPNLLRYDCLGCHAQNPTGGTKDWTGPGGSIIPQVAHGDTSDKAGGNFNQTTARKVHSVSDVVNAGIAPAVPLGENVNDQPPGLPHTSNRHVFTSETATDAFDMFTCAGARGCHGTRSQILVGGTVDNGTANNWEIDQRRTGIAAISGSHHNNIDGAAVTSTGYDNLPAPHDGAVVAAGYRFIVGLQGYENTAREYISGTDHNEYYGNATDAMGTGCGACHVQDTAQSNTRAAFESGIVSINNSMSGFCSSCHGYFHSSGGGDYVDNGVSGAFLRHPSDYVIPGDVGSEYAAYTNYDPSAPVARPTVVSSASDVVVPGTDMVMCLSCHVAHGSANDYLLRFDYATMTAGNYQPADIVAMNAAGTGGCLSCHTAKGVLPQDR